VKERPILFNGAMVQAILAGRKTQTRRVMKPQPQWHEGPVKGMGSRFWEFGWATVFESGHVHTWDDDGIGGENWDANRFPDEDRYTQALLRSPRTKKCPYGQVGDRLWVRETWSPDCSKAYPFQRAVYRANDDEYTQHAKDCRDRADRDNHAPEGCLCDFRWRPSIHMPRSASRIMLENMGVRVERLQEISEDDARAEGYEGHRTDDGCGGFDPFRDVDARDAFLAGEWASSKLKKYGNPWVWVIEFRRLP
jgi:hypothetical protein